MSLAYNAQAQDMDWWLTDFPPYSHPIDGRPGTGAVDQVLRGVVANWPEKTTHQFRIANTARIWTSIDIGTEACYTSALRTPQRDRQAYLSDVFMLPPIQLIVRKDRLTEVPMNSNGEVQFNALIMKRNINGALVAGRAYGTELDAALASNAHGANLKFTGATVLGTNIFKMIAAGRVDYTLDYDFILAYQMMDTSALKTLVTLPIDIANTPLIGSFACPRTPWGKKMIDRIDYIVSQLAQDTHYRDQFDRWLTPATKSRYAAEFDEFYKKRARMKH
ncbi:TIGR02285 family protein [Duganella sp. FT3S]|uniref:TIGR02285 family protein n=1 Tax=Rugamonas fusca TaxID=2758568 RepID=A0A7W2I987_9BURK|nr:TIGR02285 family protein [Rugamonas fusca]MBA5608285.1 TIGR02285 family protein [Rugamonas fusca]